MDMSFYTFRYALIKDKKVDNIIMVDSYHTAQAIAQAQGYIEPAVCVDQYLVTIGDDYVGGKFIHNGNEIEMQLTLAQENAKLKADNTELRKAIVELATA